MQTRRRPCVQAGDTAGDEAERSAAATPATWADVVHGLCAENTSSRPAIHTREKVVHSEMIHRTWICRVDGIIRHLWTHPGTGAVSRQAKPACPGRGCPILSIMCSMPEDRLALIGKAIDEVAAALSAGAPAGAELDDLAVRLARIWAMIAELDPAIAGRLRDYTANGD